MSSEKSSMARDERGSQTPSTPTQNGSSLAKERDPLISNGEFDLLQAIKDGNASRVQELVDSGVDLYARYGGTGNCTPLQLASQSCCLEIVKILVAAGAPLESETLESSTPLMLVVESSKVKRMKPGDKNHYWELASAPIESSGQEEAKAIDKNRTSNCLQVLQVLVGAGANVNYQDDVGWTPLMYTAYAGNTEAASVLEFAGADVSATTNRDTRDWIIPMGSTALHIAVKYGHVGMVQLLVRCGADVTVKNSHGVTPQTQVCMKEESTQKIHELLSG